MRVSSHLFAFAVLGLGGCLSAPIAPALQLPAGNNTITGSAQVLYPSGFTRDCADQTVVLLPATSEIATQVAAIFGTAQGGSVQRYGVTIGTDTTLRRQTACGRDGRFQFSTIPDGRYYVMAQIRWLVRWQNNVVTLMQPVVVANGQTADVELKRVF